MTGEINVDRIGVFICHCGLNIAASVNVDKAVELISKYPGVVYAQHYIYNCSNPGQNQVRTAIREKKLNGIIMANCSPALHQGTFRKLVASEGLNPFHCEIANIREQCSWPHSKDPATATLKAVAIIKATIEKVRRNLALVPPRLSVTRRAAVIGGGIAGMQAALDIADAGYEVVLIEREPRLGGQAAKISGTFLTLEWSPCAMSANIARVMSHPKIKVYTNSELEELGGFIGNFVVKIRRRGADTIVEENVGAVIVATGYGLYPKNLVPEYESDPDVLDGMQFEQLLSPDGPTAGIMRRPSDGRVPRDVVFVKCVGSRDPERGVPYCSKVCCMYTAKQALYYKRKVPDGKVYIFYMDIRATGKGYEEFIQRATEEAQITYLRGRVSRIFRESDKLMVWGTDTLTGKAIEIPADLVVLATAIVPSAGTKELARKLNILTDAAGFISEAHIKLKPVETLTAGIFLAGTTHGPKDIPETTMQASGAAAKVISLFTREALERAPEIAVVDEEVCAGCGYCERTCTYKAVTLDSMRKVSHVNEAICEGCGACAVACPSGAMQLKNMDNRQIFEMIDVMAGTY